MSIPAKEIVSVVPSVLGAGGNPLALNGLILSEAAMLPTGAPRAFTSAESVSKYFGPNAVETAMAGIYFNGFSGSTTLPGSLLFSRYATDPIAAFNRAGTNTLTLSQLTSIGTASLMTMVVDGTVATCTGATLSGASSFSEVASRLTSAFTGSTKPTVTYDSTFAAFTATSNTTGDSSTIAYGVGALADSLNFTKALGAVLSQGSAAETPAEHMSAILPFTQNWMSFTSTFEPLIEDKEAFATWTGESDGRYLYAPWDTDISAIDAPGTLNASFGQWLANENISGVMPVYADTATGPLYSAFILGTIASIDFTATNGRITLAFRSNSGLVPYVTDADIAANLLANGYNFYGAYATANDTFIWLYNGQISGAYGFADSYINATWLNNQIQLAMMTLFANTKSVPYNNLGYGLIRAAAQDPIDAAVNFGAIRSGVPLSAAQIAEVNMAAGLPIDQTLSSRGWYLQITPATAQVRALRQSPPCTLWYMDGESVQQLTIASIDIQ